MSTSDPIVKGRDLIRRVSVASDSFACDHCKLRLPERPGARATLGAEGVEPHSGARDADAVPQSRREPVVNENAQRLTCARDIAQLGRRARQRRACAGAP